MQKLVLVFVLVFVCSCSTVKTIPVETIHEVTKTDTLYINNIQYDSIYINHEKIYEPLDSASAKLPPFEGGPGRVLEVTTEYRYKLLRDTIYRTKVEVQRDSIPYEVRVVETKEVQYVPPWVKTLAWIGGIAILLLLLYIAYRILKLYLKSA